MTELFKAFVVFFETLAVVVLIGGSLFFFARLLKRWLRAAERSGAYLEFRKGFGRTLLLALDLLVAADIVLTMAIDLSYRSLGLLGGLVVIRTFLHMVIELELTGRWPWQHAAPAEEKPDA